MNKLKAFNTVRIATKNQARFECTKCGSKVHYIAMIGTEGVCKSCYDDFRKQFGKQYINQHTRKNM